MKRSFALSPLSPHFLATFCFYKECKLLQDFLLSHLLPIGLGCLSYTRLLDIKLFITVQIKLSEHPICLSITVTIPGPFLNSCFSSIEHKPGINVTPPLPGHLFSRLCSPAGTGAHTAGRVDRNPRPLACLPTPSSETHGSHAEPYTLAGQAGRAPS